MRRCILIILLQFSGLIMAQDIKDAITIFDRGIEAYQQGNNQDAQTQFTEASTQFKSLLQGVLTDEDKAYAHYYNATALYFIARISKNKAGFDDAIAEFQEAVRSLKDASLLGDEYLKAKYMLALSSFRKSQIENVERSKIKWLTDAVSAFEDFLADSVLKAGKDEYVELRENGTFFLGYCYYLLGYYRAFTPSLADAKENIQKATERFESLGSASQENLAIASKFMSGVSHYTLARIYMRVPEEKWQSERLSTDPQSKAIENELTACVRIFQDVVSKSGSYQNINKLAKLNAGVGQVGLGSVGDKNALTNGISGLMDIRDIKDIGDEAVMRVADGQLLQYLIFGGSEQAVTGVYSGIASKYPEAYYWTGWVYFIGGNFDQALSNFNNFISRIPRGETRYLELEADAKFRIAESFFWKGVKEVNITLLDQAKSVYTALVSPQGQYYSYLTSEQIRRSTTRLFLINVEGMLQGNPDVKLFDAAMTAAGLSLPSDAESYIEAGKYFLEKGIREAENKREIALRFAERAFDLVINANVTAEIKNRAKFLKGVALVKLSTLYEGEKLAAVANQARDVLSTIASPYDNEAKYVTGISYFIQNDWENARATFSTLKARGHIRATYYYGLCLRGDCKGQAQAFLQIQATVKDRTDYWYQSAELELAKLSCRNEVTSPGPLAGVMSTPPMTYENLVDEAADRARKKREALFLWQRDNKFATIVDVDDLISDKPPKTNVVVELIIEPKGGDEQLLIDGKSGVAKMLEPGRYQAELTRGKHTYQVRKKGFYLNDGSIKVSKSENITISMKKAVRYTRATEISASAMPMDVQNFADGILILDGAQRRLVAVSKSGSVVKSLPFDSIGVSFATGFAVDGEQIYIVDSRANKVIRTNIDGTETKIIVYPKEEYDGKRVSNPTDISIWSGNIYIVDSGNHRILKFEGENFRRAFGEDSLRNPFGITSNSQTGDLYIADWGAMAVFVYDKDGNYKDRVSPAGIKLPVRVRADSEGYIWVVDMFSGVIGRYDENFRKVALLEGVVRSPRGIAQIGKGPDANLFIISGDKTEQFKGSWDNAYMPE